MIESLISAIQFLTRIPINISVDFSEENIKGGIFFFPFVGMLIGSITYLIYKIFLPLSVEIASIMAVLGMIIITGGLHLDGLSDTFDGFFSNREKEEVLKIMSDSRIGAFGVISLIMVILLKYIGILTLDLKTPWPLILTFGNTRLMQSHKIGFKKFAKSSGLGALFSKSNPKKLIILSGIIYIGIIVIVDIKYLIPFLTTFIFGEVFSHVANKKIGGYTGDVLGAVGEMGEVVSILTFIGVMKWI